MQIFNLGNILCVLEELLLDDKKRFNIESKENNIFESLSNNSSKISQNGVFVAIKGSVVDGHFFVNDAITKGAKLIIHHSELIYQEDIFYIKVSNSYYAYAKLAELFCDYPAKELSLIGITGTNGKTTTAFLMRSIMEFCGEKCGLISTVEYSAPGINIVADRTTPDALSFQKLLCEFRNAKCKYVIMEVSSHALDQQRIGDAKFASVAFTNLTGEHLDYHKTIDAYFEVKSRLFLDCLDDNGSAVINIDDKYGASLAKRLQGKSLVSFGKVDNALFHIENIKNSFAGLSLSLKIKNKIFELNSPLYGEFNAYNIINAFLMALSVGLPEKDIISAIKVMKSVPGRLEAVYMNSGVLVFVDYAHTDDALANVLKTLNKLKQNGRLIVVFGCGGDRDKSKRPRMGRVAANLADEIIITSDNPRTENPENIINDILNGIQEKSNYSVFVDRKQAIEESLIIAKKGDIVLIAGKGHETYQEIMGERYPFDDRNIVTTFK